MAPKSSDPREKTIAAGHQLQQALLSASEALRKIAEHVPSLFPKDEGSTAENPTVASLTEANHNEPEGIPTNKRKRREKDPEAPEKPPSAYHLYAKEKRDQVKEAIGGTPSGTDVVHEINRLWKGLADELKKVILV
jgi:HMG-box domain